MRSTDIDPQDTRGLDALDAVTSHDGADRAADLIDRVLAHAREQGTYDGVAEPGPYINTIPPGQDRPIRATSSSSTACAR